MVRWADSDRIERAVEDWGEGVRRRHPDVVEIYWYGSWVSGTATPASDVDLCVVVGSDDRRPRDRVPELLPERFPVGVDLVVLTEDEMAAAAARAPSWHEAVTSGRRL